MPDTSASGGLPPDVADQVRTYLGAFLPAGEVDEAVAEVATDSGFWGDTDRRQILAVTHAVLASRLRVATDVEVLVLNEDVGLPVPEIAEVLALTPVEVRRILDEALALIAEPDAPEAAPPVPVRSSGGDPGPTAPAATPAEVAPAPPGPRPEGTRPVARSRRRAAFLVTAALVVAGVAVVAAWVVGRDGGCAPAASICVEESVLTADVDEGTGAPGTDRDVFALGDEVRLWFRFERQVTDPGTLEVRWFREGITLYETEVRLGAGDELTVPFVALWADQPGRYRVEVAEDDRILLTRDFRIEE